MPDGRIMFWKIHTRHNSIILSYFKCNINVPLSFLCSEIMAGF